jgi:hypothetical protein
VSLFNSQDQMPTTIPNNYKLVHEALDPADGEWLRQDDSAGEARTSLALTGQCSSCA